MRLLTLFPVLLCFQPLLGVAENTDMEVDPAMEKIRIDNRVPALAAIAMIDGKIVALSATGMRKLGSPEKVTTADRWHIGSCTKSMTATVAAMLVEQGKLQWETTVGEVFPEWRETMNAPWRGVTLEQLLTHRSGAPGNAPPDLWAAAWLRAGCAMEQRLAFVHGLVARAPEAPPGTKFIYSNQGYAIAGAMLERVTGTPWEELMQKRLFLPLGMDSAGFGAPASPGKLDQPWGHEAKGEPVPPGPAADNPPAIGPAGTVHASLCDLAHYAAMHAGGETRGSAILKAAGFVKLHTPAAGQDYAMGWEVAPRDWAGGVALTHQGSNTMFYTNIWIAPRKDAVFIAATNIGGDRALKATDDAVSYLIRTYLK